MRLSRSAGPPGHGSEGRFAGSVVPVKDRNGIVILDIDEHIRPDTDMDALAGLEPSFRTIG